MGSLKFGAAKTVSTLCPRSAQENVLPFPLCVKQVSFAQAPLQTLIHFGLPVYSAQEPFSGQATTPCYHIIPCNCQCEVRNNGYLQAGRLVSDNGG